MRAAPAAAIKLSHGPPKPLKIVARGEVIALSQAEGGAFIGTGFRRFLSFGGRRSFGFVPPFRVDRRCRFMLQGSARPSEYVQDIILI